MSWKEAFMLLAASIPNVVTMAWFVATWRQQQKAQAHKQNTLATAVVSVTGLYNAMDVRVTVLEDREEQRREREARA